MQTQKSNLAAKKELLNHLSYCLQLIENTKTTYLNSINAFKNNLMDDLSNRYDELISSDNLLLEDAIDLEDLEQLRKQVADAKFQMARKREYQLDAANLENLIKLQPDNIEHQEALNNINQQIYFIDVEHEGWEELEAQMIELEEQYRFQCKNETLNNEVKSILNAQKEEMHAFFNYEIWAPNNISKNANLTAEFLQTQISQLQNELGVPMSEKEDEQNNNQPNKNNEKVAEQPTTIFDVSLPSEGYMVIKTNPAGYYELLLEEENFYSGEIHYAKGGEKYQDFEKLIRDSLAYKLTKGYPTSIAPNYRTYLKTILNEEILLRFTNDSEALNDDFFEEKEEYHDMSLLKLWETKLKCKFNFDTFQMEDV